MLMPPLKDGGLILEDGRQKLNRYLTAKIVNAPELNKALGKIEASQLIQRVLKRIARDARVAGGKLDKQTTTRVIVEFADQIQAEAMAWQVDAAINEVPVPKGLRLKSAVFVSSRDEASDWQQSQFETLAGKGFAPTLNRPQPVERVVVKYDGQSFALDFAHAKLSIGREEDNDIVVRHEWVSRHHATLSWSDGKVAVSDGSSNSTYIRYHDSNREIRIWRDSWTLDRDASLAFGMPLAVSSGRPVCIDVHF